MSNIAVYKTSELDVSTNFTNQFLDSLLEQYCSEKFQANTIIQTSIPRISLEDLVKFAYPGYYCKAPGLYGSLSSTDVLIVYEEHLHNTLQEALSHKLSRLFVAYQPRVKTLHINSETMPHHRSFDPRSFSFETKSLYDDNALRSYLREAFPSEVTSDLPFDKLKVNYYMHMADAPRTLVYKPTTEVLHHLDNTIRRDNYSAIRSLGLFTTHRSPSLSCWIAMHVHRKTTVHNLLKSLLTEDDFKEFSSTCSSYLLAQKPIFLNYFEEQRAKIKMDRELAEKARLLRIEMQREEQRAFEHKRQLEKNLFHTPRHSSDPNTTGNCHVREDLVPIEDAEYTESKPIVHEIPKSEGNGFVITIVLTAIFALLFYVLFGG